MSTYKDITILYVDDEPINLMLFEKCFNDKYNIRCAESGQLALELLEQDTSVSIIISDMKMPEMNGIQFIRKVKEKKPQVPCFILTGYEINNEIAKAIDERLIIECFKKPFDMDFIDSSIEKHFN